MIIPSYTQHKGIAERVIRTRNGSLARIRFEVIDVDGNLRARVISVEPIYELETSQKNPAASLCLAGFTGETESEPLIIPGYQPIVSPFSELFFFNSQPTRAPSLF